MTGMGLTGAALRSQDAPTLERVEEELSDLGLLRRLPLDRPQRLLFGARLASVRREPGRGWVVRLEADSGVLITDPGAAVACFLSPEDEEVHELLQRQDDHAVDSDFILETIVTRMPFENYEKVFNTFVRWARYGDLFDYDEVTHRLSLHQTG